MSDTVIPKCLICGSAAFRCVRGMCGRCYGQQRALVLEGKTTWAELEADGKAAAVDPQQKQKYGASHHRKPPRAMGERQ